MPKATSPAHRLLKLHERMMSLSKQEREHHAGTAVWQKVLDCKHDYPTMMRKLSLLPQIPLDLSAQFREIPNLDHDVHLGWVDKITSALTITNLAVKVHDVALQFDQSTINIIRICESHFIRHQFAAEANLEELEKLRSDTAALIKSVFESDELDQSTQRFMLKNLDVIARALDEYALRGRQSLQDGLAMSAGLVVVQREVAKASADSILGKRWTGILTAFVLFSSSYEGVKHIAKDVSGTASNILSICFESPDETDRRTSPE